MVATAELAAMFLIHSCYNVTTYNCLNGNQTTHPPEFVTPV